MAGRSDHSGGTSPPDDSARHRIAHTFEDHRERLTVIAAAVLGRAEGAEDVVQEALRIALEKQAEIAEVRSLPAWLAQVVRLVALNTRRARQKRPGSTPGAVLDGQPDLPEPPASPVNLNGQVTADQASFDDQVLEALNELDERARACLLLRVVFGLPYREIAETLGIPEGTAMSHVLRSRRALAARLQARESR